MIRQAPTTATQSGSWPARIAGRTNISSTTKLSAERGQRREAPPAAQRQHGGGEQPRQPPQRPAALEVDDLVGARVVGVAARPGQHHRVADREPRGAGLDGDELHEVAARPRPVGHVDDERDAPAAVAPRADRRALAARLGAARALATRAGAVLAARARSTGAVGARRACSARRSAPLRRSRRRTGRRGSRRPGRAPGWPWTPASPARGRTARAGRARPARPTRRAPAARPGAPSRGGPRAARGCGRARAREPVRVRGSGRAVARLVSVAGSVSAVRGRARVRGPTSVGVRSVDPAFSPDPCGRVGLPRCVRARRGGPPPAGCRRPHGRGRLAPRARRCWRLPAPGPAGTRRSAGRRRGPGDGPRRGAAGEARRPWSQPRAHVR